MFFFSQLTLLYQKELEMNEEASETALDVYEKGSLNKGVRSDDSAQK